MVQTVVKEAYTADIVVAERNSICDNGEVVTYTVSAQTTDMSYEDRTVYFNTHMGVDGDNIGRGIVAFLKAEQAIELGQKLIEHGTKAFMANMINHQAIHETCRLFQFIEEGRVFKLVMTVIDEHPANHGSGFRTYRIKPIWLTEGAPQYHEDFTLDKIIHWSPFDDDYRQQLAQWKVPIEFVGYDRDEEVRLFKQQCEEMK